MKVIKPGGDLAETLHQTGGILIGYLQHRADRPDLSIPGMSQVFL
jgi:hypothetical protein